jgi:hypothetical protein
MYVGQNYAQFAINCKYNFQALFNHGANPCYSPYIKTTSRCYHVFPLLELPNIKMPKSKLKAENIDITDWKFDTDIETAYPTL